MGAKAILAHVSAVAMAAAWPHAAIAHNGGRDEYGCHYHCHTGPFADETFASKEDMLARAKRYSGPAAAGGWFASNTIDPGQVGDMFGAVNAPFTGLAFAGVIITIILQRDELSLQRDELRLTREELAGAKRTA